MKFISLFATSSLLLELSPGAASLNLRDSAKSALERVNRDPHRERPFKSTESWCRLTETVNSEACGSDEYCSGKDGECFTGESLGRCESKPDMCTYEYDPVCGCDGRTYSNRCDANANGVNVESEEECHDNVRDTGCSFPDDSCSSNEFCSIGDGDCRLRSATVSGRCEEMPEICTAHWDPVCGCDGLTYGNSCEASAAGVNVESHGECREHIRDTSCSFPGDSCSSNEFCSIGDGDCRLRNVTVSGRCEEMPELCTREFNPVCGCDGFTYSNSCEASAAGVNVESQGECPDNSRGTSCSFPVDSCSSNEFCSIGVGDCRKRILNDICPGFCEKMPEICPTNVDKVCGCDGRTYSNSCVAAAAGINVMFEGRCMLTEDEEKVQSA